ncbi:MAG: TonB family protein, partial [Candidatus Angelobacter sp.]
MAAEETRSRANFKIVGAVAVLVLAAISTFAILKMRKSNATPSPAQHAQEAPSQTATTAQQESPEANNTGSVPVNPPANAAPVASPSTNTVSARTVTAASENNKKPEKGSSAKAGERAVEAQEPAAKATPATVALRTGPSRINSSRDSGQTAEIAPTLTVSGENVPSTLSALARPINSNSVSPAALVQSDLEPMKIVRTVPPLYPAIARVRRLSGQVTIEITVGKDGKAHNPKLVGGQPIFRDAAFDAARQWVFKPARLNGKLIEQTTRIKMDFH